MWVNKNTEYYAIANEIDASSGKKASIVTSDAEKEILKSETMRSDSYYRHR